MNKLGRKIVGKVIFFSPSELRLGERKERSMIDDDFCDRKAKQKKNEIETKARKRIEFCPGANPIKEISSFTSIKLVLNYETMC